MAVAAVDDMFERFKETRAIIFDMRGYPHGTAWAIAPRLTERLDVAGALFERPIVNADALPSEAKLGIWETYNQIFLGRTLARPARISSGFHPWRWKSTMSDCMKTAQP